MTKLDEAQILDLFFKDSHTCFVLLDKNFNFIRVNQAYAKACGHSVDFFPGKNHFDLYPSDAQTIFEDVRSNKEPLQISARPFVFPDDPENITYWDWILEPILDDQQEISFFVFSLNDVTQKVRAQQQSKQNEARLQMFFNAIFEVIVFHDMGIVLDVSPSLKKYFGYEPEEMIGRNLIDYVATANKQEVKKMMQAENDIPYQISLIHKDGRDIPTDVYCQNLSQDNSCSISVVCLRDISRRIKVEQSLKASQKELQIILDDMLDVFFRTDLDGQIMFTSKSIYRLVGLRSEEIVGQQANDFFARSGSWEIFIDDLKKNNGRLFALVLPLKHKKGPEVWVSVNAHFAHNHQGEIVGIEGVARDITQFRETEKELRASKDLYQIMTESVPGAVYQIIVRPDQNIEIPYISTNFEEMIGIPVEKVMQDPGVAFASIVPEDLARVRQTIIDTAKASVNNIVEFRMRTSDGAIKWIHSRSKPMKLKDGSVLKHGILLDITDRKKIEKELEQHRADLQKQIEKRTSELLKTDARYHIVADNAGDVIVIHDDQGKIIDINQHGRDILGYSSAEAHKLTIFEIDPSAKPEIALSFFAKFEPGKVSSFDGMHRRKDGSEYPIDIKLTCYLENGKKIFVAIGRDVSRRREYERVLKQSEAETRALLNAIPDLMLVITKEGRFIKCQVRDNEDLAMPVQNFMQQTVYDVFPLDFAKLVMGSVHRALANARVEIMEYSLPIEGGKKDFEARFAAQSEGEVLILIRNITERKRIESMLEESARYFQSLDSVSQVLSRTEEMGQTIEHLLRFIISQFSVDQACLWSSKDKYWVVSRPNIESKSIQKSGFDWDVPKAEAIVRYTTLEDEACSELCLVLPLRKEQWVLAIQEFRHNRKWLDAEKRLFKELGLRLMNYMEKQLLLITLQDELELRKQTEQRLRETVKVAESASQAKSNFLSSMSHELRTPMNAILGFAQLLEIQTEEAELKDHVKEILHAGHHLLVLINEVLELSKIETGKVDLRLECVQINEVIQECVDLLRPLSQEKNIDIEYRDGQHTHYVWADRIRLKQILLNLLSNAVKYNHQHGHVFLHCEAQEKFLRFMVRDTGLGIAKSKQKELFTAFERLGAQSRGIEGTGIGLVISKNLIELMGGDIGLESECDQGSTFWINIPSFVQSDTTKKLASLAQDESNKKIVRSNPQNKLIVLYIEDNQANINLIASLIKQRQDVELHIAMEPMQGLELAVKLNPHVIFLDINLPGMNGYELMERIRAHDDLKNTPVVALSALAMEADLRRASEAGFRDYITKPISILDFNKMLDGYGWAKP